MSTITPQQVSRIATLSRLGLTDEEKKDVASKLDGVLQHFTSIQAIETTKVAAADAVSGLTNVARPDEVKQELCSPADLLAAAPAVVRNHVQVKAVL